MFGSDDECHTHACVPADLLSGRIIMQRCLSLAMPLLLTASPLLAQDAKDRVAASIDAKRERYAALAQSLWDLAEVGYPEERSAAVLQAELRAAGFTIEAGVAACRRLSSRAGARVNR
jgi:hypothetical protein